MINLSTPEQRAHSSAMRRQQYQAAERSAAFELVLEVIHPGNLGALPPSPEFLTAKAYQLGIL